MNMIHSRKDAKKTNSRFYFTGRACGHGHIAKRYTVNAMCSACLAARRNTPEGKEYQKKYSNSASGMLSKKRHASSDVAAARAIRYKVDGRALKWQQRHRQSGKKRKTVAAWCKRNRHKTAAWWALYDAQKAKAIPLWLTKTQKAEIIAIYYAARQAGMTVDHIVPLRGQSVCGLHVPWNLQILPRQENSRKGNRMDHHHSGPAHMMWGP